MSKDRIAAFTDAVVAIIMTVLVLELDKPAAPTLEALWELRGSFAAYLLSFWWLGSFWISHHNLWSQAKRVDMRVIWWSMAVMFCLSLVPYTTSFVSEHFSAAVAQGFYGVVIVVSTVCNIFLNLALGEANSDVEVVISGCRRYCRMLTIDCVIKMAALVLALLVWPPAMMFGVVVAAAFIYSVRGSWS